jgi:alkylation response protein AidB-like acyl-CoA dehydrogenase
VEFSSSEEQQLLADALARFVAKEYSFDKRRQNMRQPEGFSHDAWRALADLGALGLPFAEEYGGVGGGPVETMIVSSALGSALVVEPFLATVVLAGALIDARGSEAQKRALLPAIAQGQLLLAFAHDEPGHRYEPARVAARAERAGRSWHLRGDKSTVLHGAQADKLIVSARVDETQGLALFLVDRDAQGVRARDYRTIDGLRAAEISFDGALAEPLGADGDACDAIERALDAGVAALCAEAVGAMQALNAQTLEYVKNRQQFGQPIGRFQVNQHKAVDMMIRFEQSKSMAYFAAMHAASGEARARRRAVSAAKAYIGQAARFVAETAIQLHGGMGVTDELPASHYAKRLVMIDFQLGDASHHIDRFLADEERE